MTQEQPKDGYAITALYDLGTWDNRSRFDAFRQARGLAPYFSDDAYGENLTATRFFVDQADTDELDQAFLAGVGAEICTGVRIPWVQDADAQTTRQPLCKLFKEQEFDYTIWPSSHAFIVLERDVLAFYATIVHNTELSS